MAQPLISLSNVSKVVETSSDKLTILNGISFDVKAGETVALIGASGSGKSTLLGLLAGLDLPSTGSVQVSGQQLELLDEEARAKLRRDSIGFVFQSFMLMPALTALENVMLPAEIKGDLKAKEKAKRLLDEVGLSHRVNHFPSQLSGGEQQRVAIARAFMFRDERYPAETGRREQDMFRSKAAPDAEEIHSNKAEHDNQSYQHKNMKEDERYPAETGRREQDMFRSKAAPDAEEIHSNKAEHDNQSYQHKNMEEDERYPAETGRREQGMFRSKAAPDSEKAHAPSQLILLCDEPTGNLDAATGKHIANLLFDLNRLHATTLVIVTHDTELASRCQRQLRLHAGELIE